LQDAIDQLDCLSVFLGCDVRKKATGMPTVG
jgi:hypothetical protein